MSLMQARVFGGNPRTPVSQISA